MQQDCPAIGRLNLKGAIYEKLIRTEVSFIHNLSLSNEIALSISYALSHGIFSNPASMHFNKIRLTGNAHAVSKHRIIGQSYNRFDWKH